MKKVAIIGCGKVGMTSAYTLLLKGLVDELVLLGRDKNQVIGEKLDLEHSLSFLHHTKITATDDYIELKDSEVVIIAAGAAQAPGQSRLEVAGQNTALINSIIPQIVKNAPRAKILIVSNPVDILTYQAYKIAGLPKGQIFGTGTTLDTSRFRVHLSEFLSVNPKSIHAYILGEHGDTSFPVMSSATIGGQLLKTFPDFSQEKALKAFNRAKTAAYRIIERKGATFYAISVVVAHIVEAILRDAKTVLPVSIPLHGYYDLYGVALSVPCIVGKNGVEKILEIKLDWEEKAQLLKSARELKKFL